MAETSKIPLEIANFASELRATFGPTVKLLRVVTDDGRQMGNARWDELLNGGEDGNATSD